MLAILPVLLLGKRQDSTDVIVDNPEGIKQIEILNNLSNSYQSTEPQKALELATEALNLSTDQKATKQEANSLFNIGESYLSMGDNIKAMKSILEAHKIYTNIGDKEGIAKSANKLGVLNRFFGDYSTALEYTLNALEIFKEIGDKEGIASSLINIGVVYRNLGEDENALKNYSDALRICEENNFSKELTNALISTGNIYWYSGDNKKALSFYDKAHETAEKEGLMADAGAGIINNIGNVCRSMGQYDKALGYYKESLSYSNKAGDQNMKAVIIKNRGITYKEKGNYSKAIKDFNESKQIAKKNQLFRVVKEDLENLAETYSLLGNFKKAFEIHKEYTRLKDSLDNQEAMNKLVMLQLQHTEKEKEQQETIVQTENALVSTKKSNFRNYIILLSLFISISVLIIINRFKTKLKAHKELVEMNANLERRVEERTKRYREENERRKIAQEQAELANDAKNRFLATISHEVRTPINAIIGFCDLTIKSDIDEVHQMNLSRVKDSSTHLLALIKDILDYSQIESGEYELKKETFDLTELVNSVINAFYLDAESKKIKLSFKKAGVIPRYFIGDPDAVRQILYNLIGNALKFTEKGEVSVSVKVDEIIAKGERVKIGFEVKDTGIGISQLKQKLIFKGFTQVDGSSSRKYGGAGLGLTISKHFVEMMDGEITVMSKKGEGSTFSFQLTLKENKKKVSEDIKAITEEKKTMHILVAEDNFLNAQVVAAFLKRLGHTSKVVNNGLEALQILTKEEFDAVLMDIEMPKMDGIEATIAIRLGKENIINPDIPIIALTAHALKDYEEKSFKAGMNSYLTKPVDIDKLSEILVAV
jgi:signal transduction histidine kinase/CheY-like chemotaxis protein